MDDYTKRLLIFMLVAMPIVMFMAKTQQPEQKKQPRQTSQVTQPTPTPSESGNNNTSSATTNTLPAFEEEEGEIITVETDVWHIDFNTAGAVPTRWQLTDHEFARVTQADVDEAREQNRPESEWPTVGDYKPVELIPQFENIDPLNREYPLYIRLKESAGKFHSSLNRRVYSVSGPTVITNDEKGTTATQLSFTSPVTPEGLQLSKRFIIPSDGYLVEMTLEVTNVADASDNQTIAFDDRTYPGMGLIWGPGVGPSHAVDSWDKRYFKVLAYEDGEFATEKFGNWEKALQESIDKDWLADSEEGWDWVLADSRYYCAALIPHQTSPLARGAVKPQHVPRREALRKKMTVPLSAEVHSDGFSLQPGQSAKFDYTLYVGPKKRSLLSSIDERRGYNLDRVMFQSNWWISDNLLRPLSIFMLWLLGSFYNLTGNYGVAIILVVIIMRLLTQPFTHMSMKSMARVAAEQKRIKPLIDAINEKYKDDPQKRSAETWKTYKEHGVNPLGMMKGCVWMLVQLPIFLALYRLLIGAIDLRGQGFLWIADLTAPDALFMLPFSLPFLGDKFNILPIMMGVSQLFAQRLQSTNIEDPTQKQMATIMPIFFVFILYNFAAGLSLYWFVSNIWQITFQIFVNKKVKEQVEQEAHQKFEERRKQVTLIEKGGKPKEEKEPTWRDKVLKYLEEKAKEAESRGKRPPKK